MVSDLCGQIAVVDEDEDMCCGGINGVCGQGQGRGARLGMLNISENI